MRISLFVFISLASSLIASGTAAPPNIVFILSDDLAWSDLACYGHPYHHTPNLDRLAAQGMRFSQAYAPAPICSASRAAILTGKTPARLHFEFVTKDKAGQQNLKQPLQSPPYTLNLPLQETTLAEVLAPAGYRTGFFGKWHVSQHYQGYLGWSPTHGPMQQGFAEGSSEFGSHPYGYKAHPELKSTPVADGTFPDDALADAALGFLRKHRDERFFLYLSQYYVHDPVYSRCRWLIEKYRAKLPKDAPPVRAAYAAMVETLDHQVGRVLDELDKLKLTDNTLIVFMSDNGGHPDYTANAPLRGSKWNLYEGGIRVPFILRWPEHVPANSTSSTVVHGCDLLPTLCAAADVKLNAAEHDGVSLLPVFKAPGASLKRTRPLLWHFPYYHPEKAFAKAPAKIGVADFVMSQTRPHSAIRVDDWKLIRFDEDSRVELYDLKSDPAEQTNMATVKPEVAAQLHALLDEELKVHHARFAQPKR